MKAAWRQSGGDYNCEIVSSQIAVFIYGHDGKEGCEMMYLIEMKFTSAVCVSAVTMVATQPDTRVQVYFYLFFCAFNNKQQNNFHPLIQPNIFKKKSLANII